MRPRGSRPLRLRVRTTTDADVLTALGRAHITCNKNGIPFDPEKPTVTTGIRLGTPALTSRGMKAEHMKQLAAWMNQVAENPSDDATLVLATRRGVMSPSSP